MKKYKIVTLAVVGLFLSLSFLASSGMAAEKDALFMKEGKIWKMHDGREVGPMDHQTTLSNGAKVMMNGKIKTTDGKETQLQEGQAIMLDGKMMEGGKEAKK